MEYVSPEDPLGTIFPSDRMSFTQLAFMQSQRKSPLQYVVYTYPYKTKMPDFMQYLDYLTLDQVH